LYFSPFLVIGKSERTGYIAPTQGKLHNLESLPDTGFTIACFPMKTRGASAGWTRAVAIIDD